MNAYIHSEISVRNRGGEIEDYLPIHDFIDSTKELCSDNRHRILHTMWGIKRVIIPIFGQYFKNSDGKVVNVKDLCEQDHVLPDYRFRFIPTLSDFVAAIDSDVKDLETINQFYNDYKHDTELSELLLSPLNNTGQIKSLLITHNSWFINEIIPKIFQRKIQLKSFSISPSTLFNRMNFELWMDNGADYPSSAKKISKL
ncbi:DUF6915 family protein [Emticicia soli]|uniref:DUF6915 family protein n=1 Tax=Emticicia soli TaxID=2027878 RepID=A0ABW5J713_9BACT